VVKTAPQLAAINHPPEQPALWEQAKSRLKVSLRPVDALPFVWTTFERVVQPATGEQRQEKKRGQDTFLAASSLGCNDPA
jgi:hypothetical protein